MVIGDHQPHAAQATVGEAAEELRPEHLGLGVTGMDAHHFALAVLVDPDGHYDGAAHYPAAIADLARGSQRRSQSMGGP